MQFGVGNEDKFWFGDSAGNGAEITNIADIDCLHKWRHVVLAFDGTADPTTAGSLRQYVDGLDKGPAISLPAVAASSDITVRRIGSRGSSSDANRLEGELGNFRVYDKQLSHAEVLQNYNAQRAKYQNKKMSFAAPDNLVLYLDAQSGTSSNYYADGTWYDLSGEGNNGSATNGPTHYPTISNHNGTKYNDLDGTDQYFEVADASDLDITGDMTISCWVRLDGAENGNFCVLVSKRQNSDATAPYMMYFDDRGGGNGTNKFEWLMGNGSASIGCGTDGNFDPTYGVWNHVVATVSGTAMSIYVNGVLSTTATFSGSRQTNNYGVKIGGPYTTGGSDYMMNGGVSVVMIHNTALSSDQVMQNYNYHKHRYGK